MKPRGIIFSILLSAFVLVLFSGCFLFGPNLNGTWTGIANWYYQSNTYYPDLTLNIDQSGTDLSGTATSVYLGTTYTIDATLDGTDITGTLIGVYPAYDIDFTAAVNTAGDEISGDFVVDVVNGPTGTFTLTKD